MEKSQSNSIVKVILRNEIKNYLFYLTYKNRANIKMNLNEDFKSEISKTSIIEKKEVEIEEYKSQMSFYKNWKESLNEELSGSNIEAVEMIFTFTREFNSFMAIILGRLKWKKMYQDITQEIIKKHFKNNKADISFYHSTDSQGYREHNHTLIYPYEKRNNKILRSPSIKKEVLEDIKKEFSQKQKELLKKHKKAFEKLNKVLKVKR